MSKEDLKNVAAVEEIGQTDETLEGDVQKVEVEKKATKLEVATVFLKNNWKKIAIGTVLVLAAGYVASQAKTIEGSYEDVDADEGGTDSSEE